MIGLVISASIARCNSCNWVGNPTKLRKDNTPRAKVAWWRAVLNAFLAFFSYGGHLCPKCGADDIDEF